MTKIKICGLRLLEDAEKVNAYNPDFVGFIFDDTRRRYVKPDTALLIKKKLNPNIKTVGVFVDPMMTEIIDVIMKDIVDIIQLHGDEDEKFVKGIKDVCDIPVIKAFVIETEEDVERAKKFPCDYILLDGGLGQGKTFDWSLAEKIGKPFFLAGGISAENVIEGIEKTKPFAVDVSSSVETDGVKDEGKIKEIIEIVRNYEGGH